MKTVFGRLAAFATFALAIVTAIIPPAPASEPVKQVEERPAPPSVFAGTAIGVVLEANDNEVPKNGTQMMRVLQELGEVAQLPVTFSAVALHSGLSNPRVIVTPRTSLRQPIRGGDGGDVFEPVAQLGSPAEAAVSTGKLTRPNLEGRLFLAANMENVGGQLKVKTFEFISWNSRKQRFDFGFIECDEVEPQIRVVDGVRCFSCHKNKGPILGQGPWSNSPHNDVVRAALEKKLAPAPKAPEVGPGGIGRVPDKLLFPARFANDLGQPHRLDTGFTGENAVADGGLVFDGMAITLPQGPAVDAAVRHGADLARDRSVYRAMARTADGRKGLVVLLRAIAAPGPLEQTNHQARVLLDQAFSTNYGTFMEKWAAAHRASSSTLIDFTPAGPAGSLQVVTTGSIGGWGGGSTLQQNLRVVWTGDPKHIIEYDSRRAEGEHGLPSVRQPSNPRAFVRPTFAVPRTPSAAVHAVGLARLIGLTEGDRAFLNDQLVASALQIDKPKVTAASLAKEVFGGPQFAEVLTAGDIPDREDFKDRFVNGLNAALKAHDTKAIPLARKDYASGPNVARLPGAEENEPPVVATTACLRCHDVRRPGKGSFSPIPVLAFDPFDKVAREAWVKANYDPKKRAPILARMLQRLATDADMPPEDSAEHETFRVKNAASFDAVNEWLDVELKKAKGK